MSDMDMLVAMGISGFGKASKKKTLDPARFDKNKRDLEVSPISHVPCGLRGLTLSISQPSELQKYPNQVLAH